MKLLFLMFLGITALNATPSKRFTQIEEHQGVRIIGGQTAHTLQFPYAAAIYVQTPTLKHFCSGTLLSNQWILTAGQCVDGAILFQIFLGSISLKTNDPGQIEVATSNFVLHPEYNPMTLQNDIGLIELRMPITFTDYIRPIDRLPLSALPDYVTVSTFGWGQTSDEDAGLSNDLQWVNVVTIHNTECKLTYGNQITEKMVCVDGNFNEGLCYGDIGSSLIQYYSTGHAIPVGIASFFSSNGCESTDPSGFTRTYPYNDWIRNVTGFNLFDYCCRLVFTEVTMKLILIFILFTSIKMTRTDISSRIIGGFPATIHQYPFAAAIDVHTSSSKHFCGGSLYTNQFILTAGQCVNGAILFTVYLGSANRSDPNIQTVAASEYILHPDYNPQTLDNDIGLIKLRMPVTFTDSIKSINYLAIEPLLQAHKVRAIGWGQTSDESAQYSDVLQYVYVAPITNDNCKEVYGSQITDNMVCVEGNYNEGACHGDTGSPLIDIFNIYYTVHVGIASFVSGNGCESTDPSGYTRTYNYVDWIKNVTTI
ncbi:transmembrane protease serine 2-like [Tribolium madens]|uniref:transmembrane protease serine 2-like n=1 Tax=Tribolium madens TaxID=41895 RepID=UPI001CF73D73|nr:transmembrane protease serine 2-like [Tribolium madens]